MKKESLWRFLSVPSNGIFVHQGQNCPKCFKGEGCIQKSERSKLICLAGYHTLRWEQIFFIQWSQSGEERGLQESSHQQRGTSVSVFICEVAEAAAFRLTGKMMSKRREEWFPVPHNNYWCGDSDRQLISKLNPQLMFLLTGMWISCLRKEKKSHQRLHVVQSHRHCHVQHGPEPFPSGHPDLLAGDRELWVDT